MDLTLERDCAAIGSLFQQIIADMKNTSPLWEDFVAKASKLHACLRTAIQAITAYLDAFQKIADAATNSKGASKEIGTALTRVCLRHKAVETRMKTFTTAIMDCLIIPLQDKLEDWKRQVATLDKEHAKEYKRCRTELKKRSSDTLRLQKKAKKGQSDTIQSLVDSHMHDVTLRRAELEDVEKKSLRAAMVEERMRYCSFVNMLQPVVKEECEVMSELGHLQEAMDSIAIVTKEPSVLPQSSEELISESKYSINLYPESPGGGSGSQGCSNSLGSRKSSVCSISSMNSSGSSGSPSHHHYQRSLSQLISPTMRLKPGESNDSGFCSSPALTSQTSTNTSQSHTVSTWPPHSQDAVQTTDRPHTISSGAYEKGHQRPALTVYTFQNPEIYSESPKSPANMSCRPPLPVRYSSLERPLSSTGTRNNVNLMLRQCPSPIPAHITKEIPQHQPTYVNMSELASMAALKITNHQQMIYNQQQKQQLKSTDSNIYNKNAANELVPSNQNNGDGTDVITSQNNPTISSSSQLINLTQTSMSIGNYSGDKTTSTTITATTTISNASNINNPTIIKESSSNIIKDELKITETDSVTSSNNITNTNATINISNTTNNNVKNIKTVNNTNSESASSPDKIDEMSIGSVIEKKSLFEKLEQKQQQQSILNSGSSGRNYSISSTVESIYGNRKDSTQQQAISLPQQQESQGTLVSDKNSEQEVRNQLLDKVYEDSIQELNNLIGELDSFQREHELEEQANRLKFKQQEEEYFKYNHHHNHNLHNNNNNYNNKFSFIKQNVIDADNNKDVKLSSIIGNQNVITINGCNNGKSNIISSSSTSSSSISVSTSTTHNNSNESNNILNNNNNEFNNSSLDNSEINPSIQSSSSSLISPSSLINLKGFENPTFAHLNNTKIYDEQKLNLKDNYNFKINNDNDNDNGTKDNNDSNDIDIDDNDDIKIDNVTSENRSPHFIICDNSSNYVVTPDINYLKQNSEVIVLRCKQNSTQSVINNNENNSDDLKLRLSSFRCNDEMQQFQNQNLQKDQQQLDQNNQYYLQQQKQQQSQQQHQDQYQHQQQKLQSPKSNNQGMIKNEILIKKLNGNLKKVENSSSKINTKLKTNNNNNNNCNTNKTNNTSKIVSPSLMISSPINSHSSSINIKEIKSNLEEHFRSNNKPTISPRPASLSSGCVTRIARRSSVNNTKPPPPVRRSSSVTPSHNSTMPNTSNLVQQNVLNMSTENLPPPPAFLLDKSINNCVPSSAMSVAETVKALNVIRHTPASPGAIRKIQINQSINNQNHINNCISTTTPSSSSSTIYHQEQQQQHQHQQQNNKQFTIYNNSCVPTSSSSSPSIILNESSLSSLNNFSSHSSYPTSINKTLNNIINNNNNNIININNNKNNNNNNENNNEIINYNFNKNNNCVVSFNSSFKTPNSSPAGIYTQPKQVTKMSSFRTPSPGPQKANANLIAQINARLTPNKTSSSPLHQSNESIGISGDECIGINDGCNQNTYQDNRNQSQFQQQQQQKQLTYNSSPNSPHHHHHHYQQQQHQQNYSQSNDIYAKTSDSTTSNYYYHGDQQSNYDDYSSLNNEKSTSIKAKTKAEFLESLNAKLAKQGLSGKAFAVRNLINSKALPDPRLCHESLMDQIKRGAPLKRNRTINDRSAPKIH